MAQSGSGERMNALSKFGFLLISGSSIGIIILKILVKYQLFIGTWLYTDLSALAVLFGFIFAIAIILLLNPVMRNFIIFGLTFLISLFLVYTLIVPVYLIGV